MRVLFCGGRDFTNREAVLKAFDATSPSLVITGGARGADELADKEAARRGINRVIYPANWNGEGRKAAGPLRNRRMLELGKPDLVVAFPGGWGTVNMIEQAKRFGVPVREWWCK